MGLFSKKQPCAICGGKVDIFLPMKIGEEYVCDKCAEKIDMPDERRGAMTMTDLREYLAYYEENRALASQFVISAKVGMGAWTGDSVFDFEHRLFCLDENLNKLVFQGQAVKSFTISEDNRPIFEGTAQGLTRYESNVAAQIQAMAPQATLTQVVQSLDRLKRLGDDDPDNDYGTTYHRFMDFQEPFQDFHINIRLDHPYYSNLTFKRGAPQIISSDPNISRYLREYEDDFRDVQALAEALMRVAFPDAGVLTQAGGVGAVGAVAAAPAAPADAIGEIKKYKELLDTGIITQEEFDAKKRQLMGI